MLVRFMSRPIPNSTSPGHGTLNDMRDNYMLDIRSVACCLSSGTLLENGCSCSCVEVFARWATHICLYVSGLATFDEYAAIRVWTDAQSTDEDACTHANGAVNNISLAVDAIVSERYAADVEPVVQTVHSQLNRWQSIMLRPTHYTHLV